MKNVIALIVLVTSCSACSYTSNLNEKKEPIIEKITKEEALNLLHQWTDAYLTGDAARLDEVLDESWVYSGSSDGKTTHKAATIEEFSNADYKFQCKFI